jgi:hypothetical protein
VLGGLAGNQVFVFRTKTSLWEEVKVDGAQPSSRWGHSAGLIGEWWRILIVFNYFQ